MWPITRWAGADINESTLGEVASATLGGLGGESGACASCSPESLSAVTCSAAGAINLPAPLACPDTRGVSAVAQVKHPRVLGIEISAAPEAKIDWGYDVGGTVGATAPSPE